MQRQERQLEESNKKLEPMKSEGAIAQEAKSTLEKNSKSTLWKKIRVNAL